LLQIRFVIPIDEGGDNRLWDTIMSNDGQNGMCNFVRIADPWQITLRALLEGTTDSDRAAPKCRMNAWMNFRLKFAAD